MAFSDYNVNPNLNVTIGGVSVAESCPPANINNAIRQLAADGKALLDSIPNTSTLMPKAGGAFSGNISRATRGGYLHFNASTALDGRVYVLPEGSPRPTGAEGVIVFYYAP